MGKLNLSSRPIKREFVGLQFPDFCGHVKPKASKALLTPHAACRGSFLGYRVSLELSNEAFQALLQTHLDKLRSFLQFACAIIIPMFFRIATVNKLRVIIDHNQF